MSLPYLPVVDQVPSGEWFVLDVAKEGPRKWDWVAFLISVHPDDLKHCSCKVAFLYVHPNEYHPDPSRVAQEVWVRIPGKHRNKDLAWEAFQDMMAARLH